MADKLMYLHDFSRGVDVPYLMHDNGDGTWSFPVTNAEITEIEHHFHNWDRRYGLAAAPSGETHRMDGIGPGVLPFVMTAGNNTWGTWVQVVGSNDTSKIYDLHNFLVSASQHVSAAYYIQVAFGATAAGGLSAGTYSELIYVPPGNANGKSSSIDMRADRSVAGTKVWCRVMCVGQNAQTLSAYLGMHFYDV